VLTAQSEANDSPCMPRLKPDSRGHFFLNCFPDYAEKMSGYEKRALRRGQHLTNFPASENDDNAIECAVDGKPFISYLEFVAG
jgi:hypothetical protein